MMTQLVATSRSRRCLPFWRVWGHN